MRDAVGLEILKKAFSRGDFARFHRRLRAETELLSRTMEAGGFSARPPAIGVEIETWLIDADMHPAAVNAEFLAAMNSPLASPELAKFNVEFISQPLPLRDGVFSILQRDLAALWTQARAAAAGLGIDLLMIGTLPTVTESVLTLANMSPLNRFHALNEQLLRSRGKPIELDIAGHQHLRNRHEDVMLEAAATSFQIHVQIPLAQSVAVFNAAIVASAPLVAAGGNSPYLFGLDLWEETRIPLVEQSIASGGYEGAVHGPLRRASFGTGYARGSIGECFEENLLHFPVLLPILSDAPPERYAHLSLHNGTVWRWNRPLIGFDPDGTPHVRVEHRVLAAGPTLIDGIANAAFYCGLMERLRIDEAASRLPFTAARDNFYQAARHGLGAQTLWLDGRRRRMQTLILDELLPAAAAGLEYLRIDAADAAFYLDIIRQRVRSGITGACWQRRYMARQGARFDALTAAYLANQRTGRPVHEWETA
jgi:gamma-glutamyl:cysteine ligase YbdK (ATP-grasp superfamily)